MLHAPIASVPAIGHTHRLVFGDACAAGRHAAGGCSPVDDACQITMYSISPAHRPTTPWPSAPGSPDPHPHRSPPPIAIRPPARTAFAAPEYDFNAEPISMIPNINMNRNGNTTAASTNTAPRSPRRRRAPTLPMARGSMDLVIGTSLLRLS